MLSYLRKHVDKIPVIILVLVASILRLDNLGYSDYQGDEIKAFFNPAGYSSVTEFLINQRKGPGQFFVTWLIKLFNPDYTNEFFSRLPFALAGILAVYFFYKLVKSLFDSKIAFYASVFFVTNGFFVAFSRIVQYQAFVIFFMVLALYFLELSSRKSKYLFFGMLSWAASILFHYDGIFIFPLAFYFIYRWAQVNIKKYNLKDKGFLHLKKVFLITGILLAIFYLPFILNLSNSTLDYWSGRLSGDVSSKISSSKYLFTVYQPIYVVHFYTLLFAAGIFFISLYQIKKLKAFKQVLNKLPKYNFDIFNTLAILAWFLVPLVFLEGLVYIPGTHIYSYLLPMTIIMAIGIVFFERFLINFKNLFIPEVIAYTFIGIFFAFITLQSYAIFVDNQQEYPWEEEKFLIWEFHKPTPIFHLSMFGFPYYRNWEGIGNAIMSSENNGYYSTNERKSIARHYVPFGKSTDKAGHYIHILKPQSFDGKINQEKAQYWAERYPPIFTFSKNGDDLVRVYYMEAGTLEEVIEKGY